MKFLFTFCLLFYLLPGYSQQSESRLPVRDRLILVAKNNKHVRRYYNSQILKIFYRDSGNVVKVKGRLLIHNDTQIQLLPFHRKDIITINVNDIVSIGIWQRDLKMISVIIGGTGIVALGLAATSLQESARTGVADGNLVGFGLIVYSVIVLWYEVVAIPTIFLGELLSIRSERRGYHFFVENGKRNSPWVIK